MRSMHFKLSVVLIATFLDYSLMGQDTNKRIITHGALQYAGAVGFVNIGIGHTFFKESSGDLDLMFGYLPQSVGGVEIWSTTIKYRHLFKRVAYEKKDFRFYPVGGGLYLHQAWGAPYLKYYNQNNYPDGYYWFTLFPRVGLFYSMQAELNLSNSQRLAAYFEIGTYDLKLFSLRNSGEATSFDSLFNSGFGVKYYFKSR